jgi:hypothetical protein
MNARVLDQPRAARRNAENGALTTEACSLRERLVEIRALTDEMTMLSDAQVLDAMHHVRILVNHIAAHGRAEEHVVYPYITTFMSGSDLELAALRGDHVHLEDLGRAIIGWTPAQSRAALHGLLVEFLEISEAHFLVEGEDCMRIVHGHVLKGTEQGLFEAIEIETFDRVVDEAPGVVAR